MQTEREFLHQISNTLGAASISLEMLVEDMEAGELKDGPMHQLARDAFASLRELIKQIEARREVTKSQS